MHDDNDAARAYAHLVASSGGPPGGVDVMFRRIYAGPRLDEMRKVADGELFHYESRERPVDVPDGARWERACCGNMDGGPPLSDPIAILDLPHPHLVADVEALASRWDAFVAAAQILRELHELLAAWGTAPLRRIVWHSPRLAIDRLIGATERNAIGSLAKIVRELAGDYHRYEALELHEMWQKLAARGAIWPKCTDDGYTEELYVASAWVGRRIADTPSPYTRFAQLHASGFGIRALAAEQATLLLPQ